MSTETAVTPPRGDGISDLRASGVVRWLRPLAPLVLIVVVWTAFTTDPAPGTTGRRLAVSIAVATYVLSGLGALFTVRRSGRLHVALDVTLVAASAALMWLQPDGAGVAGVFVALSFLTPLMRGQLAIPLLVIALVVLGVTTVTGGGSLVPTLLTAIMLGAFYGMLLLATRLGAARRRSERLVAELERSRAAEVASAGLAERQRLAREMHDVLAHSLSGLMLQLEGARMLAAENPADPRLPEVIDRAHHLGRTGLAEARRAIGTLRDEELPGPERLSDLVARFEEERNIPCRYAVDGRPRRLGPQTSLTIYRVAQEALTNVTKHADAERVEMQLTHDPALVRLRVEDFTTHAGPRTHQTSDDGTSDDGASHDRADGTDTAADPAGAGAGHLAGYGLTGMRERAELLGGKLVAGPTDRGFRVVLEVPCQEGPDR